MMTKPNFFIVGAPKCGTTAFNDYLKSHPDIFIPDVKELHFFGSDLEQKNTRISAEEYYGLFKQGAEKSIRGEASAGGSGTRIWSRAPSGATMDGCFDRERRTRPGRRAWRV